jgi:hypothetical protein
MDKSRVQAPHLAGVTEQLFTLGSRVDLVPVEAIKAVGNFMTIETVGKSVLFALPVHSELERMMLSEHEAGSGLGHEDHANAPVTVGSWSRPLFGCQ